MKNLSKKNLRVLLLVAISITLVTCLGSTYAFFVYRGNGSNVSVEAGDINVKFNNDNNYLTTGNSYPVSDETGKVLPYYSDFSINATTNDMGIKYEIQVVPDANNSIDPQYIKLYLTDQNDDSITNVLTYSELTKAEYNTNAKLVYTNYITETGTKDFRLRMWIDESYNLQEGQTFGFKIYLYAINEKINYMAKLGTADAGGGYTFFWPDSINEQVANITEVNFINMNQSEIDARFEDAPIKEDVTDTTKSGSVKAWLETDTTDSTKYIMYVASEGTTYFPSDCFCMFGGFASLKEINFDNISTIQVTDMRVMFIECESLTSLDVSNFDTSQVTVMSGMFLDCLGLTSLDLSNFDTSKVTDMVSMFGDCSSLTSLDVSGFDTSNVTNMNGMFSSSPKLTSLDLSNFDTSKVTDMRFMFMECESLTSLDLSNFDTSSVKYMSGMFKACSNLVTIYVNSDWNTGKVTASSEMFKDCTKLVGAISYDSTKLDVTYANPTTGYFTKKTTA